MNVTKSPIIHQKRPLIGYTMEQIEREIEQLLTELGPTMEVKVEGFKEASVLDLQVMIAIVEAQKARRNDSAFILTIFSSLIALATVATTDLIESWTMSHLATFVFIWIILLMLVERFFDHRLERLVLLGEYLTLYERYVEARERCS